jgi:beta-mannosidase
LIELNDFDLRWIGFNNWTYTSEIKGLYDEHSTTRKLQVQDLTGYRQNSTDLTTHLVFNGLDTYAAVEFCGQHIANTDNQFRQWVFDISKVLTSCKACQPQLTVKFGATPNISAAIAAEPGQETWPGGIDEVYEIPNRQFVRKEQSDFGWYVVWHPLDVLTIIKQLKPFFTCPQGLGPGFCASRHLAACVLSAARWSSFIICEEFGL